MTWQQFPWRSLIALIALSVILVWYMGGNQPPSPTVAETRDARLWEAVRARDVQGVSRALAEGASPQDSPLSVAAANDDLPTMTVLLAHGADVNARSGVIVGRGYVWKPVPRRRMSDSPRLYWESATPLMEAVLHDNLAAAHLLLDRGASVDSRNDIGATALMLAAGSARPQIVAALLAHGADVNARTKGGSIYPAYANSSMGGWTALMSAAASGQTNVVRLLVANGADVNARNVQGSTASGIAIAWGHPEVSAFLGGYPAGTKQTP